MSSTSTSEQKELLDSMEIIAESYYDKTTQVYNGLVMQAVTPLIYEIKVNGQSYNLPKYGANIPTINSNVKVIVPRNNWSQAFFFIGGEGGNPPETPDYNSLVNKPSINGVSLVGNKTSSELNLYGNGNDPPYPVKSVNGKTGTVTLTTDEVPATINNRYVPPVPTSNPQITYLNGNGVFSSIAVGGATSIGNIFMSNAPSNISGYKTLSYASDPTATEMSVTCSNSADVLSAVYLYTAPLNTSIIDAGIWKSTFHMKCSTVSAGENQLKIVCFLRHSDNTETDLFEKFTDSVNSLNYSMYYTETYREQFTVLPTDTLGFRVYGHTTRNTATTIYYQLGGNDPSYINTPLALRHTQLRDLNGDKNYSHIALSIVIFDKNHLAQTYTVDGYIVNVLIIDSVTKQAYNQAVLTYDNLTSSVNNSLTITVPQQLVNNLMVILTFVK